MESSRLHRLFIGLVLGIGSLLPATADDNQPVAQSPEAKSAPDTTGDGARPAKPAEPAVPKERPRLKDNEVVSLKRRLQVHGGMSFTYGWDSGGRNFREAGAWVSYYDPESGLGLAVGFSRFSGDAPYGYGYSPYGYGYDRGGWSYGSPRSAYDVDLSWTRPGFGIDLGFSQTDFSRRGGFDGSGSSLRMPAGHRF